MRTIFFNFSGYSGWDIWLSLLPKRVQVKKIAAAFIKDRMKGAPGVAMDFETSPVILNMPWASYRILDARGNVRQVATEPTSKI